MRRIWKQLQADRMRLEKAPASRKTQRLYSSGLLAEMSREPMDEAAWDSLLRLPDATGLKGGIEQLLQGGKVNQSERQAALHPACRILEPDALPCPGTDILLRLEEQRAAMLELSEAFRAGTWQGATGERIDTLINLGIGGSDLGIRLIQTVFGRLTADGTRVMAASSCEELQPMLQTLDPATTAFAVSSKSFATRETLSCAALARSWLERLGRDWHLQMIAVTAKPDRVREAGWTESRILCFEPEIGGRYSIWSAAGLAAAAIMGRKPWLELLKGGRQADVELYTKPWKENLIVRLALRDLWHSQVAKSATRAFFPYVWDLRALVPYLRQLEMESLGKNLHAEDASDSTRNTAIFWGEWGPGAQHSLFQMLYQGTQQVPVELLATARDPDRDGPYASFLAQAEALSGSFEKGWEKAGRLPVTMLIMDELSPRSLGFLLGCWEHRVFVQARILGINPFDQWGVERGKRLLTSDTRDALSCDLAEWGRLRESERHLP